MTLKQVLPVHSKKWLSDKQAFYHALGQADRNAIRLLGRQITPGVRQSVSRYRLNNQDVEEIVNDALVITISNIRDGKFSFEDFSPVTYANGVVRRLIANRIRTKKPSAQEIEDLPLVSDFDPETYLKNKERQTIIGQLLAQLGENCRKIIEFKYFTRLKDKEVIDQKLISFSSVNSLKSKRSQCMKKLGTLAVAAGIKEVF